MDFNAAVYFIDRHLREGRGEHVAIVCGERRVTYQALFEGVNRVGAALRSRGVRKGDRILLVLPDVPEFAMYFFGAIKIGAVPVPVNTSLMPDDYAYLMSDSEARLKITDPYDLLASSAEDAGGDAGDDGRDLVAEPMQADDVAFWLYSSGSTGVPKACVHRQRDMFVCAEHYAKGILQMTDRDRCFSASKLFFAYGLGNALYYPLAVGATSILLPERPTPEKIFETIEQHRPTLFFAVPSHYAAMLAMDEAESEGRRRLESVSSIRHCISAGEALPAALLRRFQERFHKEILDGIGSTEALQAFITNRPGAVRPGSAGQLIPGYEAKILDEQGRPVSLGKVGNLWIKNDAICVAYWHQPEKTRQNLRDGWLRTGDKFSQDADGYFWYAGREDDMFKSNGVWVSPIELERVIVEHPLVFEAAVVGKKNADGLVRPVAYVVLRGGVTLDVHPLIAALHVWCADRLSRFKRPETIFILPELPKTVTGKIQRFKLRQEKSENLLTAAR